VVATLVVVMAVALVRPDKETTVALAIWKKAVVVVMAGVVLADLLVLVAQV